MSVGRPSTEDGNCFHKDTENPKFPKYFPKNAHTLSKPYKTLTLLPFNLWLKYNRRWCWSSAVLAMPDKHRAVDQTVEFKWGLNS